MCVAVVFLVYVVLIKGVLFGWFASIWLVSLALTVMELIKLPAQSAKLHNLFKQT